MKFPVFVIALFLIQGEKVFGQTEQPNILSLKEALQEGKLHATLTASIGETAKTSFTGDVIEVDLENYTDQQIEVRFEAGRKLIPGDSFVQTLILTKEIIVKLNPKEKRKQRLFAMCGQAHDGAPSNGDRFRFGQMANEKISGLAKLLSANEAQNGAGQWAMWCLTDGYSVKDLPGTDSLLKKVLSRYVIEAKAKPLSPVLNPDEIPEWARPLGYARQKEDDGFIPEFMRPRKSASQTFDEKAKEIPEFMRPGKIIPVDAAVVSENPSKAVYTIEAEFSVSVPSTKELSIIAIDPTGKLLKRISYYPAPAIGNHHYKFKVTDPAIRGIVYVRVVQGGNVLHQVKYDLR